MNTLPLVSVIMPVRNEAAFIERSLGAVLAQDYPADKVEIIVADGMSTDATPDIIRLLQGEHPNLLLIDNPGRIVATGLNAALAHARGEIVIRVDGHCEIAPDYVRRCVEHLLNSEVDGVGGPIETIGETYMSRAIALGMSSTFGVGNSGFRTVKDATMLVDTVAFPAYKRPAIELAGPFDEELVRNQDDEYNYRLRKLGGKVLLASDIRSRYYSRGSIGSLWKQYFQYGSWKVRVMQKHTHQMCLRQFVPPTFVCVLLGSSLLVAFLGVGLPLELVCGSYAFANLAISLWTARRGGWHYLPALPVVFTTLHLSYGLGFLAGLVKFRARWGDTSSPTTWLQPG